MKEKPFEGTINVLISTTRHQQAALPAMEGKIPWNNFVAESCFRHFFPAIFQYADK
ncbi:MAG: toxin-antitoxin system HicB family antitoxin [Niabella sp.]